MERRRNLWLMRHAKSSWSEHTLGDHERPLNDRGRRDTPRMAAWMSKQPLIQHIYSSDSRRTRETTALFLEHYRGDPSHSYHPELYHASPQTVREFIHLIPDTFSDVLIVFHNPGITTLVNGIPGFSIDNMPTAAIVGSSWTTEDWQLDWNQARYITHMFPKAL